MKKAPSANRKNRGLKMESISFQQFILIAIFVWATIIFILQVIAYKTRKRIKRIIERVEDEKKSAQKNRMDNK